jgi:uncharacterized lipoprotein YmbA
MNRQEVNIICAKLESVESSLHSGAFQAAHAAVKLLEELGNEMGKEMSNELGKELGSALGKALSAELSKELIKELSKEPSQELAVSKKKMSTLTDEEKIAVASQLRHFSGTISNPAHERFLQAADAIDALMNAKSENNRAPARRVK